MKKIFTILLFSLSLHTAGQTTWVVRNDSLFLKIGGDSVHVSDLSQFTTAWWGSIKGSIINQPDLQTAITNAGGYTISVQALTSSPADAATIYFGMLPKAPVTAANTSKVYVRRSGTITGAEIYCYSGTAGTAESWTLYIRKNNTTDFLISTVSAATNERVFTNHNLSIPVAAGDYFEIKAINPTWATNPLTTIFGGYVRITN